MVTIGIDSEMGFFLSLEEFTERLGEPVPGVLGRRTDLWVGVGPAGPSGL